MTALQVTNLYVPVANGLEISGPNHIFLHGHRGCGKSMMLRYMTPDCQILATNKPLKELPYLGLYTTIKTTELGVTDFDRLQNEYAGIVLAEHALVAFLGVKAFKSLQEHCLDAIEKAQGMEEFRKFVIDKVFPRLRNSGAEISSYLENAKLASSTEGVILSVTEALDEAYGYSSTYLRRGAFTSEYFPYIGPLLTYRDFLFPILSELTKLSFMPYKKPVYFLIDDADNLNILQTKLLNTWVSYRTGDRLSFKISTQLAYKTFLTISNQRIDPIHDFREIHVSSIYTGASYPNQYPQWVEQVVEKRLHDHGISVKATDFFPVDVVQEKKIQAIGEKIKKEWENDPRGYRANDDAYRYARADYIKSLAGKSKQGRSYRYAGFQQLVHISSGIVRFFLDNASEMYAEQEIKLQAKNTSLKPKVPKKIDPSIQDKVVRDAADVLMFGSFDQLESEAVTQGNVKETNEFKCLRNLIRALGGIFQEILMSDRSERRVFSIALSDDPPEEIMRILRLGVRHGYFYEAAIGTKEGNWRTRRYVMTRRLAPHFKLDPTGFSGYLFVTSALLQEAIYNPKRAVTYFRDKRLDVIEAKQLPLEF